MKKYIFWISLVLSLTLFVSYGFSHPHEDFKRPPSKEQREKIRKRIETLKMWKLTKILDLNEESAAKFFPLLNEYDKKRVAVVEDMEKNMRKLRRSVDTASESELKTIIKRLEDNHRELQEINQEKMEKLRDMLTIRDMAKLIIFKQDFDWEMKKIITKVRGRHRERMRDLPPKPEDK